MSESHGKRRVYPQAQYQLNSQPVNQIAPPGQPSYFTPASNTQLYPNQINPALGAIPSEDPNVNALNNQFNGMNINEFSNPMQSGVPSQVPVAPEYNQYRFQQGQAYPPQTNAPVGAIPNNSNQSILPLNQLYTTDLLRDLPPPIADLNLPPPPLIIPQSSTINSNPEANAPSDYLRCTLNALPNSHSLLKKSKLPLALIVRPYISLHDSEIQVPVVTDSIISRCRRCRCYINPFITFTEQGRRWRCNLCNLQNDVPAGFDYNQALGQQMNRYERVELNHSVVEFVAPPEYMVRAPQPLLYVFVLDVSSCAINFGLLSTVTRTILESLDRLPNKDGRTRVAFIGVDAALHYFKFNSDEEKSISLLVAPDLSEPFLPSPEGLLVNLKENREQIEKLLVNFPSYFASNMNSNLALGPALKSAHKLIHAIGGKIIAFVSTLPNTGIGKLAPRDEQAFIGKPKEAQNLLTNANSFYKSFAVECNKSQVTIDFFLTSTGYQDVASLSNLPRYTAGQTHFYPAWSAAREEDITKLSKEISNHLSMDITLEAVLRVRGSSGLKMSAFYGNFFNRSSDLCSYPTFPRDQSYVIEMSIEENINKPLICVQAAVLHTTSFGERRIRVATLGIPTTSNLTDIYASADQLAITNYYTHKAIEKTLSSSLSDARDYLFARLNDILTVYKKELVAGNVGGGSPLQLSTNLRMLPLLLHSLTKNLGFRNDKVPSDHRSAALNLLGSLPLPYLIKYIYPRVYSLHDMPDECGLPNEETNEILLPETINASFDKLEKYGLYLIDNSSELFLWVGGDAIPQLVEDVFGNGNIHDIKIGKSELPVINNEFNLRIRNIINKVRESYDSIIYESLYVIRGGSANEPMTINNDREILALRMWALSGLVEDKHSSGFSYREFLGSLREKINN